jgi:Uma2 family endonuclease
MTITALYEDLVTIPRAARFPIEMNPPEGFDPDRLETWPRVDGRLEYVEGKLLFMPPCSDLQQDTVADVVAALAAWRSAHPEFVVATNEAGMRLAGASRGADAAVWRRSELGAYSGGFRRVPPVLAVEVAGVEEGDTEAELRSKAAWYLGVGVKVVWLVLPAPREVIVLNRDGETRLTLEQRLPEEVDLPGLSPLVKDLFVQIGSAG